MASSLITIQQFAGYLKRDLDACDAFTAQQMLDGASEAVIEYAGWHIAPVLTETVAVNGTGTDLQTLPTMNLLALNSVDENGLSLDVTRIDWSANGLMEKRSGAGWTRRRRGIIAGMTHGFATTPGWLVTLISAVAGRAYTTPSGILSETSGGESVTYGTGGGTSSAPAATVALLSIDMQMLDRIRIPTGP